MDIGSILYEVDGIDKELARLRKRVQELNRRKKQLIDQAIENMRESGETSVTYQGRTYVLEERSRYLRKGDKKKREDALVVLADEGFHGEDAVEVYDKFTGALRGPETTTFRLKK